MGYIGRIRSSLEKLRVPKRAECGSPKLKQGVAPKSKRKFPERKASFPGKTEFGSPKQKQVPRNKI
jgi:hypothetical protein